MRKGEHPSSIITVLLNGEAVPVPVGAMASAVFLNSGASSRVSSTKEPRNALCGMGVCFECRATIDGIPHRRTCQILCYEGMRLETGQRSLTHNLPPSAKRASSSSALALLD